MTDLWSQWDIILGVLGDVQEIFHDDGRARAALDCAHSLRSYAAAALTRAERAERERDDANIEVALSQSRVAEMAEEAAFSQQRAVDEELRAERAEAEAERLQAMLDGADEDANWISTVAAQRDELQRRVDELEAALRDATGYSADPDSVDWPPTEATP